MALPEISGYSDLEVLGVGGFATVYRALQTAVDRPVAVKVLQAAIRDEDTEHRFARECNVVGSLSWHPHIAAIVDAGNDSTGHPYIVFELLEGGSLGDRLRAGTPLDWVSASGYMCQVADAAEAAHHNGVLHRDIKPDNILLDRLGRAKLADFGIAAMQDGHQTATGHVSATIAHASPEVLSGERADERSDVYLLASTLYELLAGEPPFGHVSGEGLYKAIQRIATEPAPRLDTRRADVPAGVSNLIAQSLEKDPTLRPQSAAAFGVALHRALLEGGERPPVMPWIEQHHRHLLDGARTPDPASGARVAETLAPDAPEAAVLGTPATVLGEVPVAEPANAAAPAVVPAVAPVAPVAPVVAPAPPGADAPHTVARSVAPPAVPDAVGDTPKRTRRWLLPIGLLTLLAVAAGGVSAWLVLRDGTVDFTVDAQVPSGRSEPGFEAASMVDDDLTTAWMSLEGDSPDGDQLVFGFSHQMELESITIHSGPGEDPGASLDGTRALASALIRLNNDPSCELTGSGDQSGCVSITATPGADSITVPVAQPVTDVVVWVTSTGSGRRGVAVREVEFAGTVGAPVSRSG